jgi:hypothetical protein
MAENELINGSNIGVLASIKFPALINFYEFTGTNKFEYIQNEEKLKKEHNKSIKKINIIFLGILALFILLFYLTINSTILANIITILFVFSIIAFIFIKNILKNNINKLIKERKEKYNCYLKNVLDSLKEKYFNNFRVFEFNNWCFLFYSKLGCACIDLISGEMVIYAKENIKDVLLEHVKIGSSTVGTSYSEGDTYRGIIFNFHYKSYSDSGINTDSIVNYEWHLDILTDFLEYPKLSFVFDDNSIGQDEAKIIYGILKP